MIGSPRAEGPRNTFSKLIMKSYFGCLTSGVKCRDDNFTRGFGYPMDIRPVGYGFGHEI
jgi:hypothetical protein